MQSINVFIADHWMGWFDGNCPLFAVRLAYQLVDWFGNL